MDVGKRFYTAPTINPLTKDRGESKLENAVKDKDLFADVPLPPIFFPETVNKPAQPFSTASTTKGSPDADSSRAKDLGSEGKENQDVSEEKEPEHKWANYKAKLVQDAKKLAHDPLAR